jgi:hypothetical protein
VFSGLDRNYGGLLGRPELATFNRVFPIRDDRGRLYAEASVARHKERGDFVLLRMVGRTLHSESSSVEETLGLAHDYVVQGFVELTEQTIREERWGQII